MLLTLSQPTKSEFGFRPSHDFASPLHYPKPFYSSPKQSTDTRSSSLLPASNPHSMSTSHRGLPPPAAMTLPDPGRPPPMQNQPLDAMPAPPNQWHGAEDSMRNWLSTKAEEERRRQEEEKTRQESLILERRRVEQSMLRESMQGGVPPQMIPVIFAGIGGPNLVNASLDWLQQYAAQFQSGQPQPQHQQQQQQQPPYQGLEVSPEMRRETRMINPPQPPQYAPQPATQGPPVHPQPPLSQHQSTFPAYTAGPPSPGSRSRSMQGAPTSAPRSAAHAALPRLTTNEMSVHQPPTAPSSAHPLHHSQTAQQDAPASSPSIYFHHWVPPATQDSKSNLPPTPSGRNEPSSAHPSHVGEGDFRDSPRKRKAQGEHRPAPVPSQTSPSFSNTSSRGKGYHNRSRSGTSLKDPPEPVRQTPTRRDSVAAPRGQNQDLPTGSRESSQRPGTGTAPHYSPRERR